MSPLVEFPSPIVLARTILLARQDLTGCGRVASAMPDGAVTPPFIRLTRVGDYRTSLVQETARVLVECYGGTEADTERLARRARAVLVAAGQEFVGSSWLYGVEQTVGVADFYDAARTAYRYQFEVALTVRGEEMK